MDKIDKIEVTAAGKSLPISTRNSVEICNLLRGKTVDKGKKLLELIIDKKYPVPYKRYMHGVGHRSGKMAAGRYPQKASSHILEVLKNAESNAGNKGLTANFRIKEIISNQASRSWHFGRHRRRKTKSTHIKIVLEEIKQASENKKDIKETKLDKTTAQTQTQK